MWELLCFLEHIECEANACHSRSIWTDKVSEMSLRFLVVVRTKVSLLNS